MLCKKKQTDFGSGRNKPLAYEVFKANQNGAAGVLLRSVGFNMNPSRTTDFLFFSVIPRMGNKTNLKLLWNRVKAPYRE